MLQQARYTTLVNGAKELLKGRLTSRNVCSSATIFLTLKCNCTCEYCDFPRNKMETELTANQLETLMKNLKKGGTFRVGLSGGEPLLRTDFPSIAQSASSLGFITSLVTNGIYLEDHIHAVVKLHYVLCTIEGDEKQNDLQRGAGAWNSTVNGLQLLKSKGHKKLGIVCPVHENNSGCIEEPLQLAEELGAKVFFQPVQVRQGWNGKPFENVLDNHHLKNIFSQILAWKQAGRPIGNSAKYLKYFLRNDFSRFHSNCLAGRYFHTILPDGTLLPCCMISWEKYSIPMDINNPSEAIEKMTKPECRGCTIGPYVENTSLLKPDLSAIWNALKW